MVMLADLARGLRKNGPKEKFNLDLEAIGGPVDMNRTVGLLISYLITAG